MFELVGKEVSALPTINPTHVIDEMIEELEIKRVNKKKYDKEKIDCAQYYIRELKQRLSKPTE